MKEGWSYKRFKDICYSISDGDWIEKKDQSNSGIRLIQTGNIGVGKFIPKDDSRKFISEETFNRLKCCEIYEGDILISRLPNPLGRSCILPQLNTRCITAVDCSILKIKHEIVLPHYFMYYTQSKGYFSKIESESSGTTRARITRKKIEETIIPVPPLSEQRSIVTRLDAAFSHIDALKANAEKQLNEARKLFQAELAECMKPKEGWEEKMLGEITVSMADGPFGSNLKKEHYTTNKEVRIIQLSNIGEEGWREENTKYTTFEHLKTIQRSEVKPGDVVIAKMMPAGRAILCPDNEPNYVLSSDAVRATLKEGLDKRFVCLAINSSYFRKQVYANVSGSGRVRTSLTKLRNCKLHIPSLPDQQLIVSHLDSLSSNIRKLEELQQKTIAECDALKQAMLREVFE